MPDTQHGLDRERQVREIASRLGVADFVYSAPPAPKGNALREVSGDGLLIVGNRGAILQVKSREPEKAKLDSEERAVQWVQKNARKARAQGVGTRRELARRMSAGEPVSVIPVRATDLSEEKRRRYQFAIESDPSEWPIIVVLDHPRCPSIDLGFENGVVWLTPGDWQELHRRIRSTAGLLTYCARIVLDGLHVPLGGEAARYDEMSAADARTVGRSPGWRPFLPGTNDFDTLGADLFHDVIDKIWPDDGPIPWNSPEEYRRIVEFLDTFPPQLQSDVGRWFLRKRKEVADGARKASGLFGLNHQHRLIFACSDRRHWPTLEAWQEDVYALTRLRHIQAVESGAPSHSTTLGVAALAEERGGRHGVSYFFILLQGEGARASLPADLRASLEGIYGVYRHGTGMEAPHETD